MRYTAVCVMLLCALPLPVLAQALIPPASQWHYYDKAAAPGKNWYKKSYDHRLWASGFAQLGYGEGDETTVTSFGADSAAKPLSQYFVKAFNVTDVNKIDGLKLRLLADDGAVVYLNGREVLRQHLPLDSNHFTAAKDSSIESVWIENAVDASLLKAGENFIAVEVHQIAADSSDISFDLALVYTPLQVMARQHPLTAGQGVSVSVIETKTFSASYLMTLGEGVTALDISTGDGSGDADLYVGVNKTPTLSDYRRRSATAGNGERLVWISPPAGVYHIKLYAHRPFADVQLMVCVGCPCVARSEVTRSFAHH